jgi:cytochrome b
MQKISVWDPIVRAFHWALVISFILDALIIDAETKLHEQIGYFVVGLVLVRVLWGFVGTRYARFSAFPLSPRAALDHLSEMSRGIRDRSLSHNPVGALMVYNLLFTMIGLGVTGYLATLQFYGGEVMEEVHELLSSWAVLSVVIHVASVIYESRRSRVNLTKAMLTGRKEFAEDV